MTYIVQVQFPDGSTKDHHCATKAEAERKQLQAFRNPVVQRTGANVIVIEPKKEQA